MQRPAGPEPLTGPANQSCSSPDVVNIVHLPERFHCKGGYLKAIVREIDLALSPFFYVCFFFLFLNPRIYFAESAQYPLFTTLITGCRKDFLAFQKSHPPQNLVAESAPARCFLVASSPLTCVAVSVSFSS